MTTQAPSAQASMPDSTPAALSLAPLFHLDVELRPPLIVATPSGTSITAIVEGGRFEGDRLAGEVLPGGGDWLVLDDQGVGHVDVRIVLRIDGGPLVHMTYEGRIVMPDDGLQRLAAGERLDVDDLYFRTAPTFATERGTYEWLNRLQAVAVGALTLLSVHYEVFEVV